MNDYVTRLAYLYKQYADGKCTKEERIEFMNMVSDSDSTDQLNILIENDIESTFIEHRISNSRADELYSSIIHKAKLKVPVSRSLPRISRVWKAAAIFILLVGIATLIYWFNDKTPKQEFATNYGIIDTLVLPDNSIVVLNANSKLKYNRKWNPDEPRELWLEGEAFFRVRHIDDDRSIKPYERFLVHVDHATIEVLGTSFNIRQRRGKTEIVLDEGKIKVSFDNNIAREVIMQPGQLLTFDPKQQEQVTTAIINPANYSAWMNKQLILINPTAQEIINYLEDVYGSRIKLSNPKMAFERIEGPIFMESLDDALFVLSSVLNVNVVKEENVIILKPK